MCRAQGGWVGGREGWRGERGGERGGEGERERDREGRVACTCAHSCVCDRRGFVAKVEPGLGVAIMDEIPFTNCTRGL
jgi:hypothetical protein